MPEAIISVHATFPKDPARIQEEAYISEPTSWKWVRCLEIPVGDFTRLSLWPKHNQWIRFAMLAITGAEGHLSNAENDDTPVDYDLELLPTQSIALYYHTPIDQKRRQFPVDLDLDNPRLVTSSGLTSRRENFRDDIIVRDRSCILLGVPAVLCDAVHLLPHNKGDDYIRTVTERRGGPVIDEIDDVRNGLLLSKTLHEALGRSFLAFLRLPNFAMGDHAPQCIAHSFNTSFSVFGATEDGHVIRSGSAVHISQDNWPPNCLFDITYGLAVLLCFGADPYYTDVSKAWKDQIYIGGATTAARRDATTAARRDATQRAQEKDQKADKTREANRARDERYRRRTLGQPAPREGLAPLDILDAMYFWQTGKLPLYLSPERQREAEQRQLAETERRAKEKVAEWQGRLVS